MPQLVEMADRTSCYNLYWSWNFLQASDSVFLAFTVKGSTTRSNWYGNLHFPSMQISGLVGWLFFLFFFFFTPPLPSCLPVLPSLLLELDHPLEYRRSGHILPLFMQNDLTKNLLSCVTSTFFFFFGWLLLADFGRHFGEIVPLHTMRNIKCKVFLTDKLFSKQSLFRTVIMARLSIFSWTSHHGLHFQNFWGTSNKQVPEPQFLLD